MQRLDDLFKKTGKSCQIHLAFANNIVIFKELTLPFLEYEQIQQILAYELESQIPFAIKDVLFDFIITQQDILQKKSTILVGIVTQKDVEYYTSLIEKAGRQLHTVTIDLFSLYGLFAIHPRYRTLSGATVLVDMGFTHTTIAIIINHKLAGMRTINQGLASLAKNIAEKTNDTPSQVIEFIIRFGLVSTDKPEFNAAMEEELASFAKQLQFTFDAFATQINNYQIPQRVILISRGTQIRALDTNLSTLLALPVEFFDTQALLTLKNLKLSNSTNKIPVSNLLSLGAAYPFTPVGFFNLLAHKKTHQTVTLLQKQLFATLAIIVVFFAIAIGYSYLQYSSARTYVNRTKQSALAVLNQEFDISDRNLNSAVESAKQKLEEFEQIWEGISGQSRLSPLKYLQELSINIDRAGIGLDLKNLIITKKSVSMKGQVRDYPALKILEEKLNDSKLFALSSVPQELNFEIKLAIKSTNEEPV